MLSMLFLTFMLLVLIFGALLGILQFNIISLFLLGVLAVERTATVWKLGWKARCIALAVVPEQIYSIALLIIFGIALFHFFTGKKGSWHTT